MAVQDGKKCGKDKRNQEKTYSPPTPGIVILRHKNPIVRPHRHHRVPHGLVKGRSTIHLCSANRRQPCRRALELLNLTARSIDRRSFDRYRLLPARKGVVEKGGVGHDTQPKGLGVLCKERCRMPCLGLDNLVAPFLPYLWVRRIQRIHVSLAEVFDFEGVEEAFVGFEDGRRGEATTICGVDRSVGGGVGKSVGAGVDGGRGRACVLVARTANVGTRHDARHVFDSILGYWVVKGRLENEKVHGDGLVRLVI